MNLTWCDSGLFSWNLLGRMAKNRWLKMRRRPVSGWDDPRAERCLQRRIDWRKCRVRPAFAAGQIGMQSRKHNVMAP